MKDIEEMIADAKAEEEVAKEQAKEQAKQAENFKEDFREALKEQLKDAFTPLQRDTHKVTISLFEYNVLRQKEKDLERILYYLMSHVKLGFDNNSLKFDGNAVDIIKVMFPETYDTLLAAELAAKEAEGE